MFYYSHLILSINIYQLKGNIWDYRLAAVFDFILFPFVVLCVQSCYVIFLPFGSVIPAFW